MTPESIAGLELPGELAALLVPAELSTVERIPNPSSETGQTALPEAA